MKTIVQKIKHLISYPVRAICENIVGDNHHIVHRLIVGIILMILGVNIADAKELFHSHVIQLSLDGTGYLLHGIGAAPVLDLLKIVKDWFDGGAD